MKNLLLATTVLIGFMGAAHAQDGTVTGAAGGAVTGAVVGGPVGAVVGGAVGAIAGTAIDPPPQRVVQYVAQQPMPTERISVEQDVIVGKPLPREVVLTPIAEDPAYAYAIVNERRVIVDPKTYTVVHFVE
ncbi:DUF1236 domain-containing protein [Rhizobiaceae bacterium CRRU44]|uniref:DUF1236 domain-containing protein n=1 Tax=Ferranicluibacter rubi TaxID=2715133 RepID=A0AA44CCX2_9HYPH|nr:DUF1236 domain-containing protein [Ferranicluibacter rubi]NHT76911.1 DUF1236 domain-containing protein [Ferranicluibacter rubi]TCQ02965.1 uncharacterized protein DUF1236 [Rhizobium sp. PP-F2F-G36]